MKRGVVMNIFRRCLLVILSFWLLAIILPERAEAEHNRRDRHRRTRLLHQKIYTKKDYRYIRSNDFNDDGVVDARDRLIWLEKNKYSGIVYITDDNRSLIEVMDIDENGNLQPREIIEIHNSYDTNRNGILEDGEVDAAVDYQW